MRCDDGGADLALDVVADDRHAGVARTSAAHSGSLAMNTGMALTNADAGVEAGLRVVASAPPRSRPGGRTRARRRGCRAATCGDVDRLGRRLLDDLAVELAEAVERRAAHARSRRARATSANLIVLLLLGEDRLAEVEADLVGVDVERGDELDVADVVAAELDVHEAGHVARRDRRRGSTRRPARGSWRSCRRRRWRGGSCSWMGASCGGDVRLGDGRDELLLGDARELVEPAEVVGQGSDVALLERAEVGVGGRQCPRADGAWPARWSGGPAAARRGRAGRWVRGSGRTRPARGRRGRRRGRH